MYIHNKTQNAAHSGPPDQAQEQTQDQAPSPQAGGSVEIPSTPPLAVAVPRQPSSVQPMQRSHWLVFAGVIGLSAFLNLFQLQIDGWNAYYAASVKSMSESWHNFFYVAFDPGGFISIDKPPVGLWIQVLSAKIFGFSSLSLLLPQAFEGVFAVALLFYLVRRPFGMRAATLASLIMAITPIEVVMSRSSDVEETLLLVLLLATWAIVRAVETGRLRWLLLSMLFVGVGFNVKMLEAYLVLPALVLFYLLFAARRWRSRVLSLALALVLLIVVSFSWISLVDLTPATQRPYVGSSQTNSELELALGYNGLGRLFHQGASNPPLRKATTISLPITGLVSSLALFQTAGSFFSLMAEHDPAMQSVIVNNPTGSPGPLRLFIGPLGAQGSWLLLFALVSLPVLAWQRRWRRPHSEEVRALVLWGSWLLVVVAVLSIAVHMESYYVLMLVPPISVLSGVALTLLWRDYQRRPLRDWRGWMLPGTLLLALASQMVLLMRYPGWGGWLTPLMLIVFTFSTLVLLLARLLFLARSFWPRLVRLAFLAGLLAILIAPFTWSVASLTYSENGDFPVAGPPVATLQGTLVKFEQTLSFQPHPYTLSPGDQHLLMYLLSSGDRSPFLFATITTFSATSFILATGLPVMALGGYGGSDHVVDISQLAMLISHRKVRFFWLPFLFRPATGQFVALGGGNVGLTRWVAGHCQLTAYQAKIDRSLLLIHSFRPRGINRLYDCARIAYNGSRT